MKISFIIPAYNAALTVKRCIDSLICQTDSEWEAIIVDDGSKDETYEILKRYAQTDSRIIVMTQDNQGPGVARNNALQHANGEYVAFLDSDDYIEPNYLFLAKRKIREEELDVLILDNFYEDKDGKIIRIETLSGYKGLTKEQLIGVQMTGKMPWGGWRKIIKHDIIKNNEIMYSEDPVGEEALFSFQTFYYAERIGFLEEVVYHYIDYPLSQSKKGADDPWGAVVDKLNFYIKENLGETCFEQEINSFAYTALVVSMYRISINYSFFRAVLLLKEKINEISKKYEYNCNKECMEKRVKIVLPFVRMKFVFPVIIISRLKKWIGDILKK